MLDPKSFNQVVVLCGGWSSEREISLQSGEAIVQGLRQTGVEAVKVDLHDPKHIIETLCNAEIDCAFIALHGKGGEDGIIQGVLDSLAIPYTGSGVLASAMAMDKLVSKQIWRHNNLPTPLYIELFSGFDSEEVISELGLPLAVKPVAEGSSIGITCVREKEQLLLAWEHAISYGGKAFAEKWIEGEEYSVAFVGDHIFPPIRLSTSREFYDYQAKYHSSDTEYTCSTNLDIRTISQMQAMVWLAAEALQISGWGRIDLRRDESGACWLLEANTVPGMTAHSLVPMSAKAEHLDFPELTLEILATANRKG